MPSSSGFILSLVGGLLDFASASMLLLAQLSGTGMMEPNLPAGYVWAGLLIALGALVIGTAVLSVATISTRLSRASPVLMTIYGIVMVIIGGGMSSGYILMTGTSALYAYGMLLVGALMAANGILSFRKRTPM